jgi:tetratricopeptide (TPR) repeat protein
MLNGDLQQRIERCEQRLVTAPDSRAFAPLADALREAGRYEEALPLLEAGLVQHPQFVAALVILGHTLLDAGRGEHARKVLGTVLERDAENLVAVRLLTEDARSRRAWDEAVTLLAQMVLLDPDEPRWPQALSEARANRIAGDPAEVPETSFATMTLVEIYLAQGYRAKAMTALRQMQSCEPERADIQKKIAEIGILENPAGAEPGEGTAAVGGASTAYAQRRTLMAAKRAEEKKSFEDWIGRARTDESKAQ